MKKLLLMAIFLMASTAANALLWVEPYVGYQLSTDKYTRTNSGILNGEYETAASGAVYGAKVGISSMGFAGGLHYEMGSLGLGDLTSASGATTSLTGDYDTTNIGAFVTFTMLPLVNLTASYYFSAEREITANSNASLVGQKSNGNGFGLGAGFTLLPFISINAEFRMLTFDEETSAAGVVTTYPTNTYTATDEQSILLSVSVPFDI